MLSNVLGFLEDKATYITIGLVATIGILILYSSC